MQIRPMHEVEKRRNRKSLLKSEAETFCKFLCKNLNYQNAVKKTKQKTAVQSKLVQSHPDVESSAPGNFKIFRFLTKNFLRRIQKSTKALQKPWLSLKMFCNVP